ncbi:hypothetical protein EVAR_67261_1 [Eumeta japonica]|uniref:Uncharacterized protein n=1 Tax=Eumeta variegata TaxID=151549 RepID=A0A4C1ZRY1_EUMVA|nr:hypothetical protein EVAR_67261_1 [Eumeta japonica]
MTTGKGQNSDSSVVKCVIFEPGRIWFDLYNGKIGRRVFKLYQIVPRAVSRKARYAGAAGESDPRCTGAEVRSTNASICDERIVGPVCIINGALNLIPMQKKTDKCNRNSLGSQTAQKENDMEDLVYLDAFQQDVLESKKKIRDHHESIDAKHFEEWYMKILPKLEQIAVVVIDNAPNHSRRLDKTPTTKLKETDI